MAWYKKKIEEPIRNLVKILRDNGFNTVCSCGHLPKPYVQMDSLDPSEVKRLFDLLLENKYKGFNITLSWNYDTGCLNQHLEISFHIPMSLAKEADIRNIEKVKT